MSACCCQPNQTALPHGLCCWLQVFHQDVLASLLAPDSAQYAVRTAHEVFTAYQQSHMSLPDIFQEHDALGLSEGMAGAHARAASKWSWTRYQVLAACCRGAEPRQANAARRLRPQLLALWELDGVQHGGCCLLLA